MCVCVSVCVCWCMCVCWCLLCFFSLAHTLVYTPGLEHKRSIYARRRARGSRGEKGAGTLRAFLSRERPGVSEATTHTPAPRSRAQPTDTRTGLTRNIPRSLDANSRSLASRFLSFAFSRIMRLQALACIETTTTTDHTFIFRFWLIFYFLGF